MLKLCWKQKAEHLNKISKRCTEFYYGMKDLAIMELNKESSFLDNNGKIIKLCDFKVN